MAEDANVPGQDTRIKQVEKRTDQANTRTEQAEARSVQAILASELRYRRLFETAQDGILILDAETGQVVDANPFMKDLLGYSQEEFLGKKLWEIGPFKRVSASKIAFAKLQLKDRLRYEALLLETKDGRQVEVEFITNAYLVDQKRLIQCNIRDITERKSAALASLRLAAIIESSDDAIIGKDLNSIVNSWNYGAEKVFGYTAREMIGQSILRLIPSDRQHEEELILSKIKRGESILHFETLRQTKEGQLIDVSVTVSPIKDASGRIIGVSKVARDISAGKRAERALRKSEMQLQTIIESLDEGVAVSDINGQLLQFNGAALGMHGFTSPDEARLHLNEFAKIFELSSLDGTVWTIDQWPLARILRGEAVSNLVACIRRIHSDWERVFSYGGTLVRDTAGRSLMAVVTITDITERRRAEQEIRGLNETLEQRVTTRTTQLEDANNELQAFSYSVSHDLRAPLRHVLGFVDLLQKDAKSVLSAKGLGHLATISKSTKRMGVLIDDLLVFSRVGRDKLKKTDVDLNELVRDTLSDFQAETKRRKVDWEVHPLPSICADRALLRMVLTNLISNALKFTSHRAEAKIEIGCTPNENNEAVIFVRDNGAGFDPKYTEKLFGVFQRLHGQDEFEGTGIGLANVQRIIHRHDGRAWAEGIVDGGATFSFSIPDTQSCS